MQTEVREKSTADVLKEEVFVEKCPVPWWKRIGMLGFMFFFIKGLIWLALGAIALIWGPEAVDSIRGFFANLF